MSPAAAISLGIGIIALGALTAIGITAALNAASRRLETILADALDHDWLDGIDDEYRTLLDEHA